MNTGDGPTNGAAEGLSFWHPASLAATWFGVGLLPKAPGTLGSLAALPLAWALARWGGIYAVLAAAAVLFALGLWAAGIYLRHCQSDDPGAIVIDEVAAQLAACAVAGLDPLAFALAFALFRVFDIMKPWPIKTIERSLPGAPGVMADDAAAAFYTVLLLIIFFAITERHNVFF